ncbi:MULTISPECIES: WGxxGxxG family protein [Paenibacillus]|uniref:WGxxGxxG family protein n=1 Tax=Paenibacillus TaxID=44249 RepID=UPI00048EF090|nr:WGxxGxxG family protein [Paenibacillus massiliensis]
MKRIVAYVLPLLLVTALSAPAFAQHTTDRDMTYQNNRANYQTNSVRANAVDNDNNSNWGWLGLLGLIGLAGMRKRVPDRSDR